MRLISKFHDYYDGVTKTTGHDKSYTFVRHTKAIRKIDCRILRKMDFETKRNRIYVTGELIGFCGKLYPCVKISTTQESCMGYTMIPDIYLYEWEDVQKHIQFDKVVDSRFRFTSGNEGEPIKNWLKYGKSGYSWFTKDDPSILTDSKILNIFQDDNVAYFRIHKDPEYCCDMIEAYPNLKELSFFKIFDTFTCFQIIEQFLTNDLVRPDRIDIPISDVLKAETHGFDKLSFRKDKGKKRRKRN